MDLVLVSVNAGGTEESFHLAVCVTRHLAQMQLLNKNVGLTQLSCPPQCQLGPPGHSGQPQTWQTV